MSRNLDGIPQFNMDRFDVFKREASPFTPAPIITRNKRARQYSFVLGAADPEMDEIEKLLREEGEALQYAMYKGRRVAPWNAYIADPVRMPVDTIVVLIECEPVLFEGHDAVIRIIDHHRPGDPGHDLPPESFWAASSIGQLHALLHKHEPKREHVVLAAMDHCVAQARLGNCPGIDPEEVKTLGIEYIARRKSIEISVVMAQIRKMERRIGQAKTVTIGAQQVIDLLETPVKTGYSLEYLCLQESLVDLGLVGLIATKNRVNGPEKIVLCGAATPETVRYFMNSWAPAHKLVDIYGVPARGYAGGYRE